MEVAVVVEFEEGVAVVFDVIDEEDAVEVVDLMEEGAGEVAGGLDADFGAIGELGFDASFIGAGNETVDEGDGEAALVVFDGATFGFDDFGVDKCGKCGMGLVFHVISYYNDTLVYTHLGCGHRSGELVGMFLFPVETGLSHVGNNLAGLIGDFRDFG